MIKFQLKEKLFIIIILATSISLILQVNSNTAYAQNSITIQNDSSTSSNDTLIGLSNSTGSPEYISIPVSKGYVNGNISYFISTDASEVKIVSSVSNSTKFEINYSPSLVDTPESSRQQGYVFINGIKGDSPFTFQLPVASATPADKGYSPLFEINYVKWNDESNASVLKSVNEIIKSQNNGELTITKSNIVINSPFVQIK
ncbi:MAG: hypothetical protein H0X03_00950 [Nitrosopumilus sp.]|nr:hypothetical protein [Nitrosopumilus sp.]